MNKVNNVGWAVPSPKKSFRKWRFKMQQPRSDDVLIKVLYCGVSRSDGAAITDVSSFFPLVPGQEVIGRVVKIGSQVNRVQEGDNVGVGALVDACMTCSHCAMSDYHLCAKRVWTYNSVDRGQITKGGYAEFMTVRQAFVIKIPIGFNLQLCAPLLSGGLAAYTAIREYRMDKGSNKIGIVGLGGLGHIAVQFAVKINHRNKVYALTRSANKRGIAARLGARAEIITTNERDLTKHYRSFDYILYTIPCENQSIGHFMELLKICGTIILMSLPQKPLILPPETLVTCNRKIRGLLLGSISNMQAAVDFAHRKQISPLVKTINIHDASVAYDKMSGGEISYRYVIDVAQSLLPSKND